MEDKDQIIKDLKSEVYDANKQVSALNTIIGQLAEMVGAQDINGLFEAVRKGSELLKEEENSEEQSSDE